MDVAFSAASRLLRLRAGEIALHVRDESGAQARPFVVRTRYGDIEARAAAACDRKTGFAASACRRARCAWRRARGRYLPLAAGAELRLDDQGPSDAAPADPHAADWMRNVLHAREMRLDAFAAELGRYRPGLLRCDPAVAPLRVSGAFQLHDTDAVLAALPATLPVSVRYHTSYWVTIGPRIAAA